MRLKGKAHTSGRPGGLGGDRSQPFVLKSGMRGGLFPRPSVLYSKPAVSHTIPYSPWIGDSSPEKLPGTLSPSLLQWDRNAPLEACTRLDPLWSWAKPNQDNSRQVTKRSQGTIKNER